MKREIYPVEIERGPRVHMKVLLPSELVRAMKQAGVHESSAAMGFDVTQTGLRMSLVLINDVKVAWTEIETDEQLMSFIPRTRHINKLAAVWNSLHMATTAELEALKKGMVITDDGKAERALVTLPLPRGTPPAEEGEAPPAGRTVSLIEQPPASIKDALAIGEMSSKAPAAQTFAMLMANGRRSIAEIDGVKVTAEQLDGDKWDEFFSVKETFMIGEAWSQIHIGGGEATLGEALSTSGG